MSMFTLLHTAACKAACHSEPVALAEMRAVLATLYSEHACETRRTNVPMHRRNEAQVPAVSKARSANRCTAICH